MADLERTYNIPLRAEYRKAPRYERTAKAVRALKAFLIKHMKCEKVLVGQALNKELWKHGIKNPPHHVKVTAVRDDEGVARAELVGVKWEDVTQKAKKEDDSSLMSKLKSKMGVDETSIAREEKKAKEAAKEKEEAGKEEKKEAKPAKEEKKETRETKPEKKEAEKKEEPKAKPVNAPEVKPSPKKPSPKKEEPKDAKPEKKEAEKKEETAKSKN
ncbi:MAG: 50S ribosomal protein L31e [Candidatus Nanoarchaeia archaeon]